MMLYVLMFLLLVICVYFGQVAGLMIHCELYDELKGTKQYVYLIPFFRIILFFYYIAKCVKDKDWEFLWSYLSCADKNIIIMCAMSKAVPELHRMERIRSVNKKLNSTNRSTLKGLLFTTHDIIECRYQYM